MPLMILGLDVGSSSVKLLRLGNRGERTMARRRIATRRSAGGHVEHDGEEILQAVLEAFRRAGGRSAGADVGAALGIATQRSTVLFWDRDHGRPLTPAFSWQDLRGARHVAALERGGAGGWVAERTGLRLSPHYSAAKIGWALARRPALRRRVESGRALWGTLGTFLVWRLSRGAVYAIDHANAQRTALVDLASLSWDPDLFRLFGLESLLQAPILPALVPTILSAGVVLRGAPGEPRLCVVTGDQQAAFPGLGGRFGGETVINYGSGAFLLREIGAEPGRAAGLLTTLVASWGVSGSPRAPATRYALEGTVNAAGTAIDWAERRLGLRVPIRALDRFLGPDDGRPRAVHFLPAVSGLGAPHWDAAARPGFHGDLRGAAPRDLLRAVVESIACRCVEIARRAGSGLAPILVSGGLTRCRTLLQTQADLLGRALRVRESPDATAEGAALLASAGERAGSAGPRAIGAGATRNRLVERGAAEEDNRLVRPRMSRDEAEARFRAWRRAVYAPGPAGAGASRSGRTARS